MQLTSARSALAAVLIPLSACTSYEHYTITQAGNGPRVLCVTAHPDDEIAFAGTLFKIATHLRGSCDLAVITNGEGGYKYSTVGETIYGVELTDPEVGRARLPAIRTDELRACCSMLHVRNLYLFGQKDHRFTVDPKEVLATDAGVWDLGKVRTGLREILDHGDYDFVFTHRSTPTSHGHHKAATILALETVAAMPASTRPIVLAAYGTGRLNRKAAGESPPLTLEGYPITALAKDIKPFVFDRKQKFGYKDRLDYQVVVNLAIAQHRSQGTFQTMMNAWKHETYRVFALSPADAEERCEALFASLAEDQFEKLDYDEHGRRL